MERFFRAAAFRAAALVAACAVAVIAAGAPAFAHATREQGDLTFTVGWADEPALVGQPNAVQLELVRDGSPLEGAENTLKVTVSVGGESTDPMTLRTVFDSPGEYRADLIPTVVGGYTFRFTGTVGGDRVDQTFVSPKDGFDEVTGTSAIAFPKQAPTNTELAEKLSSAADDASDAVSLPRILAIVAIVLAIVAIGLALRPRSAA